MNILVDHFSLFSQLVAGLLFLLVIGFAAWRAPWFHLGDVDSLNILLAVLVGVMLVWTMKAGFVPGLSIHLLGTTLLTLMFGWAFAVLGITLVLAAHALNDGGGWLALPMEVLVLGVVPATVSLLVHRAADRYLPNNFFIYIFLGAFFGAALSIASAVAVTSLVHLASETYSAVSIWADYTRYALLLMFPEAFLTGMFLTLFVAYKPEWVSTFDDDRYLKGK